MASRLVSVDCDRPKTAGHHCVHTFLYGRKLTPVPATVSRLV
jgi:hypothetical protein